MAKALKTIGMVVGVVALVAATAGMALPAVAATATTAATAGGIAGVASAATLTAIGTIGSIAAGVIGVATAAFAPKPSFSQEGSPTTFQTNPQSGLPYCIGRTRMSGLRIHADTYDSSYKSEGRDDALSFAVLLSAGGEIEEIESFKADKVPVTFDPSTGMAIGTYNTWMAQRLWLGGQQIGDTAVQLAFGGANVPGWTTAHKISGTTHGLWTLRFDPKGNNFGAGVPEPEWIGKWVKVYDPRKDSTYPGGSGSHRALDESTYEWSNNPALHALTWALGRWQNGKKTLGIGAPPATIRTADFVEAANVADANEWTCGGVEWSTDSKWAILKRMLQAGGAEPTMTGAMIGCRVNTPRISIATVTAGDLMDGLSFSSTRSRRDRFNTVIPRYRSEEHDWEVISGSPVSVPLYVEQDGGQRTKEIDFPLVQHEVDSDGNVQAGQLAAYEIVNSREAGPIRFTTGPKFIGVKTGDVVTLDVPDETFDAQPVLIRSRSIDPATFKITFEVETETEAKHDFALGKTTTPPPTYEPTPPDLTPPTPDASLWGLSAPEIDGALPSIVIEGVCEFPGADVVLMEYREVGEDDWLSLSPAEASAPVRQVISPLKGETDYEARVAYRSGNRVGGWLELDPVTTAVDPLSALSEDFNAGNNRNGDPIDPPTFSGTGGVALNHTSNDNGSVNLKLSWIPIADPETVDGSQIGFRRNATTETFTPGSTDENVTYYAIPDPARSSITHMGVQPTDYWTPFVRYYRRVDLDIDPSGFIYSAWAKPAAAPYRPSSSTAIGAGGTVNIDGVAAASIAGAVTNFNADNDANGLTPNAASSVALSSVLYPDSTALDIVTWSHSNSATPGNADNIDGYLVGLMARSSSSGYTYNPADDALIRWKEVRADLPKSVRFEGVPSSWYRTAIVKPFRRVRTDVATSGLITASAAQSSSSSPHNSNDAPNFTGKLDSVAVGSVVNWAGRAGTGLNSDGTVAAGMVDKDAIVAAAINATDWVSQGADIAISESDFVEAEFLTLTSRGKNLRVMFLVDYQFSCDSPTHGEEFLALVYIQLKRLSDSAYITPDPAVIGERWDPPTAAGTKTFGRKTLPMVYDFESIDVGETYDIGYRVETGSNAVVTLRRYRYLRAEDKGADD